MTRRTAFRAAGLALLLCLVQSLPAQNPALPSFEEMERRMMELQRQLWEGLGQSPLFDPGWALPQGDSSGYFFRVDTTDGGQGRSFFFQFGLPESGPSAEWFDMDDMMRQFRDLTRGFADPFAPPGRSQQPPADDGALREGDHDELLPEERLRQESDGPKNEAAPRSGERPKPAKKSKVETIRI